MFDHVVPGLELVFCLFLVYIEFSSWVLTATAFIIMNLTGQAPKWATAEWDSFFNHRDTPLEIKVYEKDKQKNLSAFVHLPLFLTGFIQL